MYSQTEEQWVPMKNSKRKTLTNTKETFFFLLSLKNRRCIAPKKDLCMLWYFSCIHKAFSDNEYTLECATIVKGNKKKKDEEKGSLWNATSMYISIYISESEPLKKTQLVCSIWTRSTQTNLNTASFAVFSPLYLRSIHVEIHLLLGNKKIQFDVDQRGAERASLTEPTICRRLSDYIQVTEKKTIK